MNSAQHPFNDFRELLQNLPNPDEQAMVEAANHQKHLTKPEGALGQLEEIALWLAGWQGKKKPVINQTLVAVFAGNHGLTEEQVTPFPQSITQKMVQNFSKGGAAINQICREFNFGLKIYDLALEYPVMNISQFAAMDETSCAATMAFGMEAIAGGIDLLCLGEMGIGNTTSSSALCLALFGGEAEDWTGLGSGSRGAYFARKLDVVRRSVALHQENLEDPFDVLRCLGGRELAAIVGAILAARMEKIPVILDGFAVTAAAAILFKANPAALDHCLVGHMSAEYGHRKLLEIIGKKPLLDFDMRLGEGTGAALAAAIVRTAAACHSQMATFSEADMAF